ncbi:hypothetical protein K8T44_004230 [Salmonella enterica]|nr:hypothetical protein [Salmonella enterica]
MTLVSAHFGSPFPNPKKGQFYAGSELFKSDASDTFPHPSDRAFDNDESERILALAPRAVNGMYLPILLIDFLSSIKLGVKCKDLINEFAKQLLNKFFIFACTQTFNRPFVQVESLFSIFHHIAGLDQKVALNESYNVCRVYHEFSLQWFIKSILELPGRGTIEF